MPYRARTWWSVALAGLALFAASFLLMPADARVGEALVGARGLVLLAGGLAFLGAFAFLAPLTFVACAILAGFGRWWGAIRLGLVALLADGTSRLLKLWFARPRPEYMLVETGGFSFPSGHATGGAAFAVLLAWFATRHLRGRRLVVAALVAAVVWAALMALGRLVQGVHHLSDVVAGIGVGAAVAGAVLATSIHAERVTRKRARVARATPASTPPPR